MAKKIVLLSTLSLSLLMSAPAMAQADDNNDNSSFCCGTSCREASADQEIERLTLEIIDLACQLYEQEAPLALSQMRDMLNQKEGTLSRNDLAKALLTCSNVIAQDSSMPEATRYFFNENIKTCLDSCMQKEAAPLRGLTIQSPEGARLVLKGTPNTVSFATSENKLAEITHNGQTLETINYAGGQLFAVGPSAIPVMSITDQGALVNTHLGVVTSENGTAIITIEGANSAILEINSAHIRDGSASSLSLLQHDAEQAHITHDGANLTINNMVGSHLFTTGTAETPRLTINQNGNVVVEAPESGVALEVDGDLTYAANGTTLRPIGAETSKQLRTVLARIHSAGSIIDEIGGASVIKNVGMGSYTIIFSNPFSMPPFVNVTPEWNSACTMTVLHADQYHCIVQCYDAQTKFPMDVQFFFSAIGQ